MSPSPLRERAGGLRDALVYVAVTWVTEIQHVEPLVRFVDEQRMGPYAFWHHQHHFEPVAEGTRMRDIVHYSVPLGPIGNLVNARIVAPRVRAVFDYRREVLTERFGRAGLVESPR